MGDRGSDRDRVADRGDDRRDDRGDDRRDDRDDRRDRPDRDDRRDDRRDDGWDDPFGRDRQDDRSGDVVTARPPEEPRVELVGEVGVFILDSFGNDPRSSKKLEKSLRGNIKKLEPCWKRESRKGNPVAGELILPMTVSAEGEGRSFGDPASDSIGNDKLLQCLQDKLRGSLFPPGLGSLEVELTLTVKEELVQ